MVRDGKTEKISVTLPRDLAGKIRLMVPQGEVSSFFTEALEHYLAHMKQKIALKKGFGAWNNMNHPELNTPQDSITYVNSVREADNKRLKKVGEINAK